MKKIVIDPMSNIYYASFHIQGLIDKFGIENIEFDSAPFLNLKTRGYNLNFIVNSIKYSIHLDDPSTINKESYGWCDIYGSVNSNLKKTPNELHSKLISLAPSFGVRLWNLPETIYYGCINGSKVFGKTNIRKFSGKYKRQWKLRLPYHEYSNEYDNEESNNYIFHLSTLWYNDNWNKNDEGVNKTRSNFILACKSIKEVIFEGGLSIKNSNNVNPIFNQVIYKGRVTVKEYIEKTKKSILVFNTPAFWDCHGWKLGEYLAMGKAIISTKLSNDLPSPLTHGVNIHFVENNLIEMQKAIQLIISDKEYRVKLEKGARDYWEKYGSPLKSIELLGIK